MTGILTQRRGERCFPKGEFFYTRCFRVIGLAVQLILFVAVCLYISPGLTVKFAIFAMTNPWNVSSVFLIYIKLHLQSWNPTHKWKVLD